MTRNADYDNGVQRGDLKYTLPAIMNSSGAKRLQQPVATFA
jgi:hypothetical protein